MPEPAVAHPPEPWALTEAEGVALGYLRAAGGDRWAALVALAEDALADRAAGKDRLHAVGRQVSRGYVRASPLA